MTLSGLKSGKPLSGDEEECLSKTGEGEDRAGELDDTSALPAMAVVDGIACCTVLGESASFEDRTGRSDVVSVPALSVTAVRIFTGTLSSPCWTAGLLVSSKRISGTAGMSLAAVADAERIGPMLLFSAKGT